MKYLYCLLLLCAPVTAVVKAGEDAKPNVLFIAVDDLNDWIGCMGGNEQSITPNFDKLARQGMLFTNAHCVAPACNPSRTATMTGRSPHKTGVYSNAQNMRDQLPDEDTMPAYFMKHGYWAGGSGKMFHYFTDARSWDEYFPEKSTEMPLPYTLYPETRPLTLRRAGPWQYVETDWGPLETTDKDFGGDYSVSEWVGNQLSKEHEKPFFLACGIYRPHEPWFVPQKYFDKFPLEDIKLPPAYKKGDIDDLPEAGQRMANNRYFPHIVKEGQWERGIQGYLASINFADAMLGRVLESLENGPNKDNTIVVLWSDHGWHLGSKEHWQKYSAWRACTRIPLMMKVPAELSAKLPEGIAAGGVSDEPVSLISLFPTLTDLCGLPGKANVDGASLVPMLKDPTTMVDPVAITYLDKPGSVGVSGKDWRYIQYHDGSEELYDIVADPYEWDNLAKQESAEVKAKLEEFRKHVPAEFAPKPKIKVKDLMALKWQEIDAKVGVPVSKPDGGDIRLAIVNKRGEKVQVFRVSPDGAQVRMGEVDAESTEEFKSKPGEVWLIKSEEWTDLGYFQFKDRGSQAVIPAS
ncbi:MAG: sulfatase [Akkermansiaceae bacterium]